MQTISRRNLLKALGVISSVPVWSRLAQASSVASSLSTTSGYKAAVCLALRGGNDANNLLVSLDRSSYSNYCVGRSSLALPYNDLLPLGANPVYGVHPALKQIQALYNSSKASIVTNIGALHAPVTKTQIQAGQANLPELYSHPSGQAEWESGTLNPNGGLGWGGSVFDVLKDRGGTLPGVISLAGNSLFLLGNTSVGYTVAQASNYLPALGADFGSASASLTSQDVGSPIRLVSGAASVRASMVSNQTIISAAIASGSGLRTSFPNTQVGSNLKVAANLIAGRGVVGAQRQIFFCQQGGFDTHDNQLNQQYNNLEQLDQAASAFYSAMVELGISEQVLLFTISDFSRTYQANSEGGTDHAWSGHQIVLGGLSHGGSLMGSMPSGEIGSSDDMGSLGTWIPTTSSIQLAAGVARWLGVDDGNLANIFPDLKNFPQGALAL